VKEQVERPLEGIKLDLIRIRGRFEVDMLGHVYSTARVC
jgi:hypothetical protein